MVVQPDGKKARRHRRRHRGPSNQGAIGMSDASTRSGSPSSSQGVSEVALSRRGSGDAEESDRHLASNPTDAWCRMGTPPRAAPLQRRTMDSQPGSSPGLSLAGTSPVRKPCPLSPATMRDASQRQPISNVGTPVSSPSKMHSFTAACGTRLLLPKGALVGAGDPFQSSPAGTPAATPMGRYMLLGPLLGSSPPSPCKSAKPGAAPTGDASQRTPLMSPMATPNPALTSWLCGSPCGRLPSGPELAELLKAALPEAYDD